MRLTLTVPALFTALALAGCGAGVIGGTTTADRFDQTCAEQSSLATQGRSDGREISIICP